MKSHNNVFLVGGFQVVNSSMAQLVYPDGKKDGNKLGKRKKSMVYYIATMERGKAFANKQTSQIFMHHEDYEALKEYEFDEGKRRDKANEKLVKYLIAEEKRLGDDF